jgi:hypothetical protein
MAKDNRVILKGVRVGKKVFKPGQEDDLAQALDQSSLNRLMDKGDIGGDWKGKTVEAPKETKTK